MEEDRTALKILTGKPTRKNPLGSLKRRREVLLEWILNSYRHEELG